MQYWLKKLPYYFLETHGNEHVSEVITDSKRQTLLQQRLVINPINHLLGLFSFYIFIKENYTC
jgi:hypothetical protein